jgi:hypothetical protein
MKELDGGIIDASRVKGCKEHPIAEELLDAAGHAELFENAFLSEFRISQGQLDGLWSYARNAGRKNI